MLTRTTPGLRLLSSSDVGTAGATGVLAPAMLKLRGRKYLFALAIICQVYQLVDSQTSKSLYSFKILIRSSFVYFKFYSALVNH